MQRSDEQAAGKSKKHCDSACLYSWKRLPSESGKQATQQQDNDMTYQEEKANQQRIERMIRELQSELCDLVRSGEITDIEANEWVNMKADQWMNGLS